MTPESEIAVAPTPAAAALAEHLRDASERAAGCVVAVPVSDAAPKERELRALQATGLAAVPVHDANALPQAVAQLRPDLVLLDVALCRTSVVDVLSELATVGEPAVIVCGSLPDPATRAALLCAGADDCVMAPYRLDELVARVLAVLRRTKRDVRTRVDVGPLVAGTMRVDVDKHSVTVDGRRVALTLLEFRLLIYLLRNRGIALTRERLLADVWGYTIGTPETVTVHICRLRAKLEADPSRPTWIETVWGVGYRFCSETVDPSREDAAFSGRPQPPSAGLGRVGRPAGLGG